MREVVHVSTCLYVRVTQRKESFFFSEVKMCLDSIKLGEVTGNRLNKIKSRQHHVTMSGWTYATNISD